MEIQYLHEKGRIPTELKAKLNDAVRDNATGLLLYDLTLAVVEALAGVPRADVPDMPDRIIAATALHLGLPLISRDRKIELSDARTIW